MVHGWLQGMITMGEETGAVLGCKVSVALPWAIAPVPAKQRSKRSRAS